MLFYDNDNGKSDASLLECKFCGQARYHTIHAGRMQKETNSIEVYVLVAYNYKITKNVCFNENNTTHDMAL